MAHSAFGLTLMVTHACNMRCHYCYTGEKAVRRMTQEVGDAAIRRAAASVEVGGHLDVGFFGGEPLLEAGAIRRWMDVARAAAQGRSLDLSFQLTTNGTLDSPAAVDVIAQADLELAISVDGAPEVHDRFRVYAGGKGTAADVRKTLDWLIGEGRVFSVIMVIRPETAPQLADGIRYLRALGVQSIEPSVDLWTHWTHADAVVLRRAIAEAADLWQRGLPRHSLNWFDEKAVELAGFSSKGTRCGFGHTELAVAPSGNLYPCERLIGEDRAGNSMRLAGHALDPLPDFPWHDAPAGKQADACHTCTMHGMCNASCRCSNFIRTGDVRTPDGLLCMLNQACLEEVESRLVPAGESHTVSLPVLMR